MEAQALVPRKVPLVETTHRRIVTPIPVPESIPIDPSERLGRRVWCELCGHVRVGLFGPGAAHDGKTLFLGAKAGSGA